MYEEVLSIHEVLLISSIVLTSVSIAVTVGYMALTVRYRNHRILRAASWKINLVMCTGALLGYTTMMMYGIDERVNPSDSMFDLLCNARLWMWVTSYTLLFMPLFAKTYRLARIFNGILAQRHLDDAQLLRGVAICVVVDLVLLTTYTAIEPLRRLYVSGSYVDLDALRQTHYVYGSCETHNDTQYYFYGLIALWKCIETLFGVYCALSVSRVNDKSVRQLSPFDETSQQLLSVGFLIVALCVAVPVAVLGGTENPSSFYGVVGLLTLSVGNVTATLNVLPRLYALVRGTADAKFGTRTVEQKMEDIIISKLKRMGINEEWWASHSHKKTSMLNESMASPPYSIQTRESRLSAVTTNSIQTGHSAEFTGQVEMGVSDTLREETEMVGPGGHRLPLPSKAGNGSAGYSSHGSQSETEHDGDGSSAAMAMDRQRELNKKLSETPKPELQIAENESTTPAPKDAEE